MLDEENTEDVPLLNDMERRHQDDSSSSDRTTKDQSKTTVTETAVPATDSSSSTHNHPDAPIDEPEAAATRGGHRPSQHQVTGQRGELELDESAGSGTSTPRFLQDERSWKRWKWVPYPVRRFGKATARWSRGPENAQPYKIKPLFPKVQEFPLRLVDKFLPKRKFRLAAAFLFIAIWVVTFALVKREETFATDIAGFGEPQEITCGSSFWQTGNRCGLEGVDCRPFEGAEFPFRCPAKCRDHQLLNQRAVGDQEIIYQPLVIGGPNETGDPVYRGDSFICGSAIHAGIVSDATGGCSVIKLVGESSGFTGSEANGISSVGFDSYFPLSYTFAGEVECAARDMRWELLAVSVVFTSVLSLVTSNAALFFFTTFTGIFWHVGLASDQPNHSSVAGLVSNIVGKYVPAMFVAWVMYDKMGVRRTLHGLTAQIEKTVLWLGACWVGALTNYTLDFIPISRLTAADLEQQPGAKAALAIIIIVIVVIVVSQVWFFRQEGRFLRYIKLYALFIVGILICLTLPQLNLRIHHYVIALLFLPGTSMQTRPCLVYQGLLIGLFLNGIARWGFDPVLQTSAALQRDAPNFSPLPVIDTPNITLNNDSPWSINFTWAPPESRRYDGISILVNDVERFRTYFDDKLFREDSFVWERDQELDSNEYFRFAYMEGSRTWDYTKAGVWDKEGEWTDMEPGPSKLRVRDGDDEEEARKARSKLRRRDEI